MFVLLDSYSYLKYIACDRADRSINVSAAVAKGVLSTVGLLPQSACAHDVVRRNLEYAANGELMRICLCWERSQHKR